LWIPPGLIRDIAKFAWCGLWTVEKLAQKKLFIRDRIGTVFSDIVVMLGHVDEFGKLQRKTHLKIMQEAFSIVEC
jgi:hypothetical protein